ncbi:MAG: hypothetical protein HC768_19115 [Acaryochloris sp. CRU_2_0]|nr:hypothetical protein [Acaryochloris sp. CRU_2_0]
MQVVQLELNFQQQLQQAQSSPQDVDWQQLCLAFDAAIARTPLSEQLALAADAIWELAELYALRAEAWFEELRYSSDDEPVVADDMFADLVRQSMSLDLDALVAEPDLYVRSASAKSGVENGSVVAYRDKSVVLAELESEIQDGEEVTLGASYEERVGEWVSAISAYLEGAEGAVSFSELVRGVRLPWVVVWLGILLGGFEVRRDGGFYDQGVWVR